MLDRADSTFRGELERSILRTLNGDENTRGLYENIVAAQTWEDFQRMKGEITAFEAVRKEMSRIAAEMAKRE